MLAIVDEGQWWSPGGSASSAGAGPEYVLAGWAAGDTPEQFELSTEYAADGSPRAVLSLKSGLSSIDSSLQELTLELRDGERVVQRQDLLVDIAQPEFRAAFLSERLAKARAALPALDSAEKNELLEKLRADGTFADLGSIDRALDTSLDRLAALAKREHELGDVLVSTETKTRFYEGLRLAGVAAEADRLLKRDPSLADSRFRKLGVAGLLLAERIMADASSPDPVLSAAAGGLRQELLARGRLSDTLYAGFDANRELKRGMTRDGDLFAFAIAETGSYEFGGDLRVDLGRPAMVQTTVFYFDVGPGGGGSAAGTSVISIDPVADAYVWELNKTTNYGNHGTLRVSNLLTPSPRQAESFLRFDLTGSLGKQVTQADLKLWASTVENPTALNTIVALKDLDGMLASESWAENQITWNTRPTSSFSSSIDTWTPVVASFNTVDVTEAVQRTLRLGDMDHDGLWPADDLSTDNSEAFHDIEAFHLAVLDWNSYEERYGAGAISTADLIQAADGNWDGAVSAADVQAFFHRIGVSRADFNLNGVVDLADLSHLEANNGAANPLFVQGDGDFNGYVDSSDLDVYEALLNEDNLTPAPAWLTLKIYDVSSTGAGNTHYVSRDNIVNPALRPKLNITAEPNVTLTEFGTHGLDLLIGYTLSNDSFSSLSVNIYKSADGTSLDEPLMSVAVTNGADLTMGSHELIVAPDFDDLALLGEDYHLVAQIEGTSVGGVNVGQADEIKLAFAGGVIQETDGTIHVQGTNAADSVTITPTEIVVDFLQGARFPFGVQPPQYVDNEPVNTTDFQLTPPGTPPVFVSYDPNVVDAYGDDQHRVSATQTLGTTASWTFSGLAAGLYQVAVSWAPTYQELSRYVRYGVFDGTSVRHAETINQLEVPGGSPPRFQDLGRPVAVTSGTLTVTVGSSFDNKVLVDAVRIERVGLAAAGPIYIHTHGGNDLVVVEDAVMMDVMAFGGDGDDQLEGGGGHDRLDGGSGNDTLLGGPGDDWLLGGDGDDAIEGGEGDDTLSGQGGSDTLIGGQGNDSYEFSGDQNLGTDSLFEAIGEGSDSLDFSGLAYGILLDLTTTATSEVVPGGLLFLGALDAQELEHVFATEFDDVITGSALDNGIHGYDGDDQIHGMDGQDIVFGGTGDDTVDGGNDDDLVLGGDGDDILAGGDGLDSVSGEIGDDQILVDTAEDYLDDIASDADEEVETVDQIGNINHSPHLQSLGVHQIDAGSTLSVQLTAIDSDIGQTLTFSALSGLPLAADLTPGGLLTWTPTNDDADQNYEIDVAVVDNGTPALRDRGVLTVSVNRAVPDVPQGLLVTSVTAASVGLSWQVTGSADGYRIERRNPGGTWATVGAVSGATFFTDASVTGGTNYEYRVMAANGAGESEPSVVAFATTELWAPINLAADVQSNGDVTLTWADISSNESGFRIEQLETTSGGWSVVTSVGPNVTTHTITGLDANADYFFAIRAYTNEVESQRSYAVAVTTAAETIGGLRVFAPSSASLTQGAPDLWFNKDPVTPTLNDALMGNSIIDAGIGEKKPLDDPPLKVRYDFAPRSLFNGDGPDLIYYAMANVGGTTVTTKATFIINGNSVPNITATNPLGISRYQLPYAPYGGNTRQIYYAQVDLNSFGVPPSGEVTQVEVLGSDRTRWLGIGSLHFGVSSSSVDISLLGIPDADEASVGGFVAINDNYDEGNADAAGTPVKDNVPDANAGDRIIGASDLQLRPATLSLLGADGVKGRYKLTFPTHIKLWKDDGAGGYAKIISGTESGEITISGSEYRIDLLIEGIVESATPNNVEIRASFTPTGELPSGEEDVVRLTVVGTDLDIDANNDDTIDETDDPLEDIANDDTTPGKVILVNDWDADADGFPDYVDGFDLLPGVTEDDTCDACEFVPIRLTIPDSLSSPMVEISYSASSPSHVRQTLAQPYILPEGHLRIWKQDGSLARNMAAVKLGGDFVAPGQYTLAELGIGAGTTTFYVEAIRESTAVADQIVAIVVRDPDMGLVLEDQVRLTATRFEIVGPGLSGTGETLHFFVASTLFSGDPANLPQAFSTYGVNIYDPRQTGITSIQIEGQSLPLVNVGGHYRTPDFYAITPQSAIPQGVSYIVMSGDDVEWQYNPPASARYLELAELNAWDAELTQIVVEVIDEMEDQGWMPPQGTPPVQAKSAFGIEVHKRASSRLQGRPNWVADVYVDIDKNLKIVAIGEQPGNLTGTTQVDIIRVKDGYVPQVGQKLDSSQIEDLYELKTSANARLRASQEERLKLVLNGGKPGPRKIKTLLSPKQYSPGVGFVRNVRYHNGLRLLGLLGAMATSYQTAHAMWTFEVDDPDFERLIDEARRIKKFTGGNREEAAAIWVRLDLNSFLNKKFPDADALREISVGMTDGRRFIDEVE